MNTTGDGGAVAAFRFMQRAQHIGKVVVRIPSALCDPLASQNSGDHATFRDRVLECDKTYVVTGGLGALGLVVAKWLVEEGARHLVLLSRSGKPTEEMEQSDVWQRLTSQRQRTKIHTMRCDTAQREDCLKVFEEIEKRELPKVRGVFHVAGVTADAALANQSRTSIEQVYLPKVQGAWNLQDAMQSAGVDGDSLDVFMMFSSVTSLLGNFGQANYAAANGCINGIAEWRRSQGLRGQSIMWGPWVEQGMAAKLADVLEKAGLRGISNELGLRVLADVMHRNNHTAVGCQSILWKNFFRRYAFETPTFFSEANTSGISVSDVGIDVKTISKDELTNMLCVLAQQVSGSSSAPSPTDSVLDLGLDSLGAVEFRNSVSDVTGIRLPQNIIFDNPTVSEIAQYIIEAAGRTDTGGSASTGRPHVLDTPLDQWLMNALDPEERFALYIDNFSKTYDSLEKLADEEDIVTALEDLGVDDNTDFERLHVAWSDLCDTVYAGKNVAGGMRKAIPAAAAKVTAHPLDDIDMLTKELNFDTSSLKPVTSPKQVKKVLLTGVTGFVGRVQVATLLEKKAGLIVYCLVRATSPEHAMERVRKACKEAKCWDEAFAKRLVTLPGDFEQPMLGLGEEKYKVLCRDIDIVYHTGGDVNLLSNYGRLRTTNTLSIKSIIDFCTTTKLKPVHFASTLGQFPAFFALFTGSFCNQVLAEDSQPDLQEMERFYPPNRQGYPWSKWAAEQVLWKAKDMGLPAYIYRLPNTYVAHNTGYTNKTDYAAALMIASVQEGVFPIGAATAPLTPVDTICHMLVDASFLERQSHWLYHLFDPRLVTRQDLEAWADEMGISYKGVKVDDFIAAVKARGPSSPVFKFLPLMQYWRSFWFDPDERTESFPIRNQNIFDEVPHIQWPPLKDIFVQSFLYSIQFKFFPDDSKSLIVDPLQCLGDAKRLAGISSLGDEEFYMQPIHVLAQSVQEECKASFAGKVVQYRSQRQHLMNVMYMQQRAALHPEILQQQIRRPLIIVGLNRTGTTFLQNVLSKDIANRSTLYYEMQAPYGPDGSYETHGLDNSTASVEEDQRLEPARQTINLLKMVGVDDEWAGIHEQRAENPEEEFMILEQCGRSYSICVECAVPSYRQWLFSNDCNEMKKSYKFHKLFLQHLQWQKKGDRWLLKMPFHLFTLDALLDTYPDAMIVFTHRDPKEIMGSWGSLVKHLQLNILSQVDCDALGRTELEAMSKMIQRALAFRSSRPDLKNQFLDIQYKDIVADPIGTVKRIYKHFDLHLSKTFNNNMSNFLQENRKLRDKISKHNYKLEDVGLTEDMVQTAFDAYYKSGYLKYKK